MKFVVTAGPTREPIDPVRFVSNRSSGKMGYAIAESAFAEGHDVVLISGPVCLPPPQGVHTVTIETAAELQAEVERHLDGCDVLVMCAAVADYRPAAPVARKTSKQTGPFQISFLPTDDILRSLRRSKKTFVVGFAAETEDLEKRAQEKLRAKNCDLIVGNDVSGRESGMESDYNELVIFARDGARQHIARAEKKIVARSLLKIILETRAKNV